MKESRWYKVSNGLAYIFDSGYEDKSVSVSIVSVKDLAFYRTNFNLLKVWGIYEEE